MPAAAIPPGAPFAFDMALRALDEQLGRIEALDTKAGVLVAADGVVAGFLLGRGSVLARAPLPLARAVIALLFLSMCSALLAFATRRWETAPAPEAMARWLGGGDEGWLRWRFLPNVLDALDDNRPQLRRKARLLALALATLLVTIALLGGYLMQVLIASGTGGIGGGP